MILIHVIVVSLMYGMVVMGICGIVVIQVDNENIGISYCNNVSHIGYR